MDVANSDSGRTAACGICGRQRPAIEMVSTQLVRPQIARILDLRQPDWRRTGYVCRDDLAAARRAHVEQMLVDERGEISALDRSVIESIGERQTLTSDTEAIFADRITFGERMADRVATFGGSWTFILSFALVLTVWVLLNSWVLLGSGRFDPYPFILLNLILSCVAAIQAPLIMMSQRRQETKDRLRSENDYRVNLKAELEIRYLHEKIDHLLMRQWERLAEIQQIQLDLMEDLSRDRRD